MKPMRRVGLPDVDLGSRRGSSRGVRRDCPSIHARARRGGGGGTSFTAGGATLARKVVRQNAPNIFGGAGSGGFQRPAFRVTARLPHDQAG